MASLMLRNAVKMARIAPRLTSVLSIRPSSAEPPIDPHKGKVVADVNMPDTLGHAVGTERFELLAALHGEHDPFDSQTVINVGGTKEEPVLVTSVMDERVVGCACEEDTLHFKFMRLPRGQPKRCHCGYWFKLVDVEYKDFGQ